MTFSVKNPEDFPVEGITEQMRERRPLPMGRQEFEVWSERIISGANVSAEGVEPFKDKRAMKFVLCELLMRLGPTESHKEDAFFIHALRKGAVNQVAVTVLREIKDEQRKELEEARAKEVQAETL